MQATTGAMTAAYRRVDERLRAGGMVVLDGGIGHAGPEARDQPNFQAPAPPITGRKRLSRPSRWRATRAAPQ
jgi:hypothetical protein